MTTPESIRNVLEFLNRNKMDLLVIQDQITNNSIKYATVVKSSEIDSLSNEAVKNLGKIGISCENLIKFWETVHILSGGLQIQEVFSTLLDSDKTLLIDLKSLGISLLRSKQAKPYFGATRNSSIQIDSWDELLSLLHVDIRFLESAEKMRVMQNERYESQISGDLQSIFLEYPNISKEDKDEFKREYRRSRLSIQDFLQKKYPDQTIPKVSAGKPKSLKPDEPKEDFDNYSVYLEANERELARMKRTGDYSTRKRGKKRKRSTQP